MMLGIALLGGLAAFLYFGSSKPKPANHDACLEGVPLEKRPFVHWLLTAPRGAPIPTSWDAATSATVVTPQLLEAAAAEAAATHPKLATCLIARAHELRK